MAASIWMTRATRTRTAGRRRRAPSSRSLPRGPEHEGVDHQPIAEAIADARAVFEPRRVRQRVRRDRAEVVNVDCGPGAGAEPVGDRAAHVDFDIAVEKMGDLAADVGHVQKIDAVADRRGERVERARHLGVAAGLHPVAAQIAVDRRLVDRAQAGDPPRPSEEREVAVDRRGVADRRGEPIGVRARVMDVFIGGQRPAGFEERPARAPLPEIVQERSGDGRRILDGDARGVPLAVGKAADQRQLVAEAPATLRAGGERAD